MTTNSRRAPLFRFLFAMFLVVALLASTAYAAELSNADLSNPDASSQEAGDADLDEALNGQGSGDRSLDDLEQGSDETDLNTIENPPLTTTPPSNTDTTTNTTAFSPLSVGTVVVDEDGAVVTAFQPGHTYTYHVSINNSSAVDVRGAALYLSVMNNASSISEDSGITYILRLLGDNVYNSNGYSQDRNYQDQRLTAVKAASGYGRMNCAYVPDSAKLITRSQPNGVALPDIELFNPLGTTAGFADNDGVFGMGRENAVELVFQVATTSIAAAEDDPKGAASDGVSDVDNATSPNAEESPGLQDAGNATLDLSPQGATAPMTNGLAVFGSALILIVLVLILVALFLLNCQAYALLRDFREYCRQRGVELPPLALLPRWHKQESSSSDYQSESGEGREFSEKEDRSKQ